MQGEGSPGEPERTVRHLSLPGPSHADGLGTCSCMHVFVGILTRWYLASRSFHDLAVLLDKDHPKADKAGIVLDAAKALRALKEEVLSQPARVPSALRSAKVPCLSPRPRCTERGTQTEEHAAREGERRADDGAILLWRASALQRVFFWSPGRVCPSSRVSAMLSHSGVSDAAVCRRPGRSCNRVLSRRRRHLSQRKRPSQSNSARPRLWRCVAAPAIFCSSRFTHTSRHFPHFPLLSAGHT